MGMQTQLDVRVIAKGGKYLGNDIGGALVTVEDVQTGELLARGTTNGGSGVQTLMEICVTRSEVLTVSEASVFSATLDLDGPRLIRVTARGPLAAQQSANTVSLTQWVYPGRNITGGEKGGGLLLEIPGLVVQVLNPPTHCMPASAPPEIEIRANVTMMCGCPIAPTTDWKPEEFDVTAAIEGEGYAEEFPLKYDAHAPFGMPSQFKHIWQVPKNTTAQLQIYEITVSAFQRRTGNTGVDSATIIIPAASSPGGSQKLK
jgi:hypothetical protein